MSLAATDERARAARRAACIAIASALEHLAATAGTGAFVFRSEELRAVSIVVEIAAELASATVSLLEAGKVYAAAALIRQLVEAEYLIALFATDATAAATWRRSSPEEIRRMFAPKVLRQRAAGIFRDSEYWVHCDLGGHPNPKGIMLLSSHRLRRGTVEYPRLEIQWADLCQHLARLWSHVVELFRHNGDWISSAPDSVDGRIAHWRDVETLRSDIVIAAMTQ